MRNTHTHKHATPRPRHRYNYEHVGTAACTVAKTRVCTYIAPVAARVFDHFTHSLKRYDEREGERGRERGREGERERERERHRPHEVHGEGYRDTISC